MKLNRLILAVSCICSCLMADIAIDCANAAIVLGEPRKEYLTIAKDLQLHLNMISRKEVPILEAGESRPDAYRFLLGIAPADSNAALEPEEGRWDIRANEAYFYGAASIGARHAVYDFLESSLNVRWPFLDEIYYESMNPIKVQKTQGRFTMPLRLHYIRTSNPVNRRWAERLHRGSHDFVAYGHAFTKYWDRFSRTHQDFFAMREDGLRLPMTYGKSLEDPAANHGRPAWAIAMCVSSMPLVRQVIEDWKANGTPWCINICENDADGQDTCHCQNCRALDPEGLVIPPPNGKHNCYADRYITFANRILAEARKIRPDVRVCMYAYNASELPPKKVKIDKDIILGIVPVSFTFPDITAYVDSWKAAGMNEFFYRPNRHYYYDITFLPLGAEKHFFEINRYMRKANAIGFDYDAMSCEGEFQCITDYMVYKSMADLEHPFEYWEDHYMQSFGGAAQEVKAYFRFWREKVWDVRIGPNLTDIGRKGKFANIGRGIIWNLLDYYKPEDFVTAGQLLDAALAKDVTPPARKILDRLKLAHDHAVLFFNAVGHKTDDNARALLKFRREHRIPEICRQEKEWGDICNIIRVRDFDDYDPPFINLNPFWKFRLDPQDAGIKEKWFLDKDTSKWPYVMSHNAPWERQPAHYKQVSEEVRKLTADYDGIAWYASSFIVPQDMKGRDIFLYFGAVDESAWVYVNGKEAGTHIFQKANDWTTPFTIPITGLIDWSRENQTVIVRVLDANGQGGIWKPVFLISRKKAK